MEYYNEYARLRSLNKDIRNTKKRLINKIMKEVRPYMWKGGYSFEFVVFPNNKYYKPRGLSKSLFAVSGAYDGIGGFTEHGDIITDAYGGALSTQHLRSLCIEDLINLFSWVERSENIFKASYKYYSK